MNKQELIKKYEEIYQVHSPFNETVCYAMMVYSLLEELKKLDEPEKVKIPQFVADWIEYCKFTHVNLQHALIVGDVYFYNYANQKDFSKLKEFLETENNQATFARAWLDGYEVEEEKRYEVILCNGQSLKTVYRQGSDHLDFKMVYGDLESFTRKQLEEVNFGWVFDCPGIEIEEVTE